MRSNQFLIQIPNIILGSITIIIVGFLFYINRYGLDLSDESFYAIGYAFKTEPVVASTKFHMLYNKTFGFLNLSLIQIRDVRLVAHLISSILLTKGIIDFLKIPKKHVHHQISVALFITIGALVSYDFGPLTFSYNTISTVSLTSIAGIWLMLAAKTNWSVKSGILATGLGFLLGIAFYNKFSNAILLAIVLPIGDMVNQYISTSNLNLKMLFKQWLFYIVGFGISILWFTNYKLGIIESLRSFYLSITEGAGDNYLLEKLIDNYIENLGLLNENTWEFYVPIVVIILIARVLQKLVNKNLLDFLLALITTCICLYFVLENDSYIGGLYRKYSIFEIYYIIYVAFLVYWIAFSKFSSKQLAFILLFFAFPFIGSVGTTNGFTAQFLFYMSFVFASIHLFLLKGSLFLNTVVKCGLSIIVLFQLYYGTVEYNYRQAPIEFDKMESFELTPFLSGLKTHKELADLKSSL